MRSTDWGWATRDPFSSPGVPVPAHSPLLIQERLTKSDHPPAPGAFMESLALTTGLTCTQGRGLDHHKVHRELILDTQPQSDRENEALGFFRALGDTSLSSPRTQLGTRMGQWSHLGSPEGGSGG